MQLMNKQHKAFNEQLFNEQDFEINNTLVCKHKHKHSSISA